MRGIFTMRRAFVLCAALIFTAALVYGQSSLDVDQISPDLKVKIDAAAQQVLAKTGVPSASVAIVEHGAIVYTQA